MIIYVISTNVMYLPTHKYREGREGDLALERILIEFTSYTGNFHIESFRYMKYIQLKSFLEPELCSPV